MPAPRSAIPPAHHARSAPVGPASYSTQLAPPRPPGPAYQVSLLCAWRMHASVQGATIASCALQNHWLTLEASKVEGLSTIPWMNLP